jgi:hypothetical protein
LQKRCSARQRDDAMLWLSWASSWSAENQKSIVSTCSSAIIKTSR